ncbi:MAG TPA: hypothetical protein P5565_13505, partial [Bacteroidia bacterium]|nr:hypothetical protein [Bacteroidia bacterium]
MKKITYLVLLLAGALLASCSRQEETQPGTSTDVLVLRMKQHPQQAPTEAAYTRAQTDDKVVEILNRQNDFNWEWADLRTLWSAAQVTGEVAVGYKPL